MVDVSVNDVVVIPDAAGAVLKRRCSIPSTAWPSRTKRHSFECKGRPHQGASAGPTPTSAMAYTVLLGETLRTRLASHPWVLLTLSSHTIETLALGEVAVPLRDLYCLEI